MFVYDFFVRFVYDFFVLFEIFSVEDGNFSMKNGGFHLWLDGCFRGPVMQDLSTSDFAQNLDVVVGCMRH